MIENFGKNIARLRKENGYSQEELANKMDMKKQSISNIERDIRYPTFDKLEKFSIVLNATPIQLFGTPKEITVSDTPLILDRIDEYDTKIQNILRAEKSLEDMRKYNSGKLDRESTKAIDLILGVSESVLGDGRK